MKRLILMRHAKSDWSDPVTSDHNRRLNQRGVHSAAALGDWLRAHGLRPDHVLCSDATRTRETLERLKLGDIPTTTTRQLYLAEPDVMEQLLHARSEDCILMVAHNPGSAMLAESLLARAPDHIDFDRFPTCATLVADFDIANWDSLHHGTGRAVHFVVPRDLTD